MWTRRSLEATDHCTESVISHRNDLQGGESRFTEDGSEHSLLMLVASLMGTYDSNHCTRIRVSILSRRDASGVVAHESLLCTPDSRTFVVVLGCILVYFRNQMTTTTKETKSNQTKPNQNMMLKRMENKHDKMTEKKVQKNEQISWR